jgi:putative oxidoreductase
MHISNTALKVYSLIRIIVGFFIFYHGWEVFESDKIAEYAKWDVFKNFPQPYWFAFIGKGAELVSGFMLMIGFKTAWASIILIGSMIFITFFIGHGKVWYDDQHPFLFVLFGLQYLFLGAGVWCVDDRN